MNTYILSFATINIVREDIAEVIINEGIEMSLAMVNEYHEFLLSHLKSPFSLLINKQHSYTYEYEAQKVLATLDEIKALAVVVYTDLSEIGQTALSVTLDSKVTTKLEVFSNRSEALSKLRHIQDMISPA